MISSRMDRDSVLVYFFFGGDGASLSQSGQKLSPSNPSISMPHLLHTFMVTALSQKRQNLRRPGKAS